jgi:hypothetical protein
MNRKWNLSFGLVIVAALFVRMSANADDTATCCEKGKACCPAAAAAAAATASATAKCCDDAKACCADGEACSVDGSCKPACCEAAKACCPDGTCAEKCCDQVAGCDNGCCKDGAKGPTALRIVEGSECVLDGGSLPSKVLSLLGASKNGRPRFTVSLGLSMNSPKSETAACAEQPNCQTVAACSETDESCVCPQDDQRDTASCPRHNSCPGEVAELCDEPCCDGLSEELADLEREVFLQSNPPMPFAVSPLGMDIMPQPPTGIQHTFIAPDLLQLVTENAQLKARIEMMERLLVMQREMDVRLLEMAMENARLNTLLAQQSQSPANYTASTVSTASMPQCTTVALTSSNSSNCQAASNCPTIPQVQLSNARINEDNSQSLQLPLRMKIDTNELVERVIQAVELKNKEANRK